MTTITKKTIDSTGRFLGIAFVVAMLLSVSLFGAGCMQSNDDVGVSALSLELKNLHPLDSGHFELWAGFRESGIEISLGKFQVKSDGSLQDLDGNTIERFVTTQPLALADRIYITIEIDGDTDVISSGIEVMSGQVEERRASLRYRALDLEDASGSFMVAVTTDDDPSKINDYKSGIWFVKLPKEGSEEQPVPSLNLPESSDAWTYSGWVIYRGVYLPIGKFSKTDAPDDFNSFSGSNDLFGVPGEDFLRATPEEIRALDDSFPLDLTDGTSFVSITLEPNIKGVDPTGKDASQFEVLRLRIPPGVVPFDHVPLENSYSATFPTGKVFIE